MIDFANYKTSRKSRPKLKKYSLGLFFTLSYGSAKEFSVFPLQPSMKEESRQYLKPTAPFLLALYTFVYQE